MKVVKVADIGGEGLGITFSGEQVLLVRKGDEVVSPSRASAATRRWNLCGGEIEDEAWTLPPPRGEVRPEGRKSALQPAVDDIRTWAVKCETDRVLWRKK